MPVARLTAQTIALPCNIHINRNRVVIATIPNNGAYTDPICGRDHGTYRYRVCEADTATCRNEVTVRL
jgi:hypothetical protein